VGFEVLTAVVMKGSIFWYIIPCGPLKVNRCFGGKYRLHLQSRRIRQERSQHGSGLCLLPAFALVLFFDPENGVDMYLRNVG
jgi:hypothetical protein